MTQAKEVWNAWRVLHSYRKWIGGIMVGAVVIWAWRQGLLPEPLLDRVERFISALVPGP